MKRIFIILVGVVGCLTSVAQNTGKVTDDADARRKTFIEDFLQTYQSAYEMKQIEYIAKFFSTDALIITETKELVKCGNELVPHSTKERPYKLIVENKKVYIERLRKLFADNKQIKLSMSGKRILQHSVYPEIYGVYFMQMWMSDNKEDNIESQMPGYIFLMIDFKKNEMQPTVHVRTWQPKDNVKRPQDKYSLYDFVIYEFQ